MHRSAKGARVCRTEGGLELNGGNLDSERAPASHGAVKERVTQLLLHKGAASCMLHWIWSAGDSRPLEFHSRTVYTRAQRWERAVGLATSCLVHRRLCLRDSEVETVRSAESMARAQRASPTGGSETWGRVSAFCNIFSLFRAVRAWCVCAGTVEFARGSGFVRVLVRCS